MVTLDSSRDLQPIHAKNFVNRLYLVLHTCVEIFDVMVFCIYRIYGVRTKHGLHFRHPHMRDATEAEGTVCESARSLIGRPVETMKGKSGQLMAPSSLSHFG